VALNVRLNGKKYLAYLVNLFLSAKISTPYHELKTISELAIVCADFSSQVFSVL
jgi:hypothetical protein